MDPATAYTDRVLLALVANGGVATVGVEGIAPDVHPVGGGQFAPDIHARMLSLLATGMIVPGQTGLARLTPAGADLLRGRRSVSCYRRGPGANQVAERLPG
jgi:hypothetical protein